MTRAEFQAAFTQIRDGIMALTPQELDPDAGGRALQHLNDARSALTAGFQRRDTERIRDEERRIIQAYRDGRLIGTL